MKLNTKEGENASWGWYG